MQSLDSNFNEVLERLKQGRRFDHATSEPVYYLVFKPTEIIQVKRTVPAWKSRLEKMGYAVTVLSMADAVLSICQGSPLRKHWLKAENPDPKSWPETNEALANAVSKGALKELMGNLLDQVAAEPNNNGFLLITDLEAIHPYMRIGSLESQLQGRFQVPTIILYPGERTGETRLKFLGYYPEDGNYRSVHVGG